MNGPSMMECNPSTAVDWGYFRSKLQEMFMPTEEQIMNSENSFMS